MEDYDSAWGEVVAELDVKLFTLDSLNVGVGAKIVLHAYVALIVASS